MALQVSAPNKHLIGIMMQVTECKYTIPVLRYDRDMTCRVMGCSLCPHALFSQAQSHIAHH